jgi:putative transcriptional regulator
MCGDDMVAARTRTPPLIPFVIALSLANGGDASIRRAAVPPNATPPAKGRFLVASETLRDPNFSETVVLLLEYKPSGAIGVIINRPTDVELGKALPDVKELRGRREPIHLGGPVATGLMLLLMRASKRPEGTEAVFRDVYVSSKLEVLRRAAGHAGKQNRLRVFAGYAGWGAGQLDREIARGDWHVTDADAASIFETPARKLWPKLSERFSGEWTKMEAVSRQLSALSFRHSDR